MRHRNRRLGVIALAGIVLVAALGLGAYALRGAIVFFYSPTEIAAAPPAEGERIRVGGLVAEGSVSQSAGVISFDITDGVETVSVRYDGALPDLFREGQGVVAEGALDGFGLFQASTILAKHDENYMPPEVAEALQESGVWRGEGEDGGYGEDPASP